MLTNMTVADYLTFSAQGTAQWCYAEEYRPLKMYLRRDMHVVPVAPPETRRAVRCLTIANVENNGIKDRGYFTMALDGIETMLRQPWVRREAEVLYVENVLNARFREYLIRRGFREIPETGYPPSCFKVIE